MGVIDIRARSASLGNLQGVQRVDTRNGAELIGAANAKLGRDIVGFGRDALHAVLAYNHNRDQTEAEDISNKYRDEMNRLNTLGTDRDDGSHADGWMQETPDDTEVWYQKNIREREKVWNALVKDKSAGAVKLASRMLAGYDLSMKHGWERRAAQLDKKKETETAAANAQLTFDALASRYSFDSDENDEESSTANALMWNDWKTAQERLLDIRGINSAEARQVVIRESAEKILQSRFANNLKVDIDIASDLPPDEAKAHFDKLLEDIDNKETSLENLLAPDASASAGEDETSALHAALGGDFDEGRFRRAMREDVEKARRAAVNEAKRRENEAKYSRMRQEQEALDAACKDELAIFSSRPFPDTPEEQNLYYDYLAEEYNRIADNPALDEKSRLSYRKTAIAMTGRAQAVRDTAVRNALATARNLQDEVFETQSLQFEAGGYVDAERGFVPYTAADMAETARALLAQRRIRLPQFTRLMSIQRRALTDEMEAFRAVALEDAADIFPKIVVKNGRFSSKNPPSTPTPYKITTNEGIIFDDKERYTFAQLIRALNLTYDWGAQRNASTDEMKRHFDELTKDVKDESRRRTIEERLEHEQQTIDNFSTLRRAYGN